MNKRITIMVAMLFYACWLFGQQAPGFKVTDIYNTSHDLYALITARRATPRPISRKWYSRAVLSGGPVGASALMAAQSGAAMVVEPTIPTDPKEHTT